MHSSDEDSDEDYAEEDCPNMDSYIVSTSLAESELASNDTIHQQKVEQLPEQNVSWSDTLESLTQMGHDVSTVTFGDWFKILPTPPPEGVKEEDLTHFVL